MFVPKMAIDGVTEWNLSLDYHHVHHRKMLKKTKQNKISLVGEFKVYLDFVCMEISIYLNLYTYLN